MRILAITSKNSGVGYHRIMMPLVNMQKDYCMITDSLSEEVFEANYDLVIMNRMLVGITPEQMIEWRNKYNFKLIVDNDDYWNLEPSHLLAERYALNNIPSQIVSWIKIADLCTCTHERLAEEIYQYNKVVEIYNSENLSNPDQIISNKIAILESLTTKQVDKQKVEDDLLTEFQSYDKDLRILTYKVLLEKFNGKYASLNDNQKEVLKEFINSVDSTPKLKDFYNTKIQEIKTEITELSKGVSNKAVQIKLNEVNNLLYPLSKINKVGNDDLVNLLQYYELLEELKNVAK